MSDIIGKRHGISSTFFQEYNRQYMDARMRIISKKNTGKLGFMELPYDSAMIKEVKQAAQRVAGKFENMVVIGIGGSALGTIALQRALHHPYWNLLSNKQREKYPRLFVIDNVDPELIQGLTEIIDFKKTLFNVISKSGTTAECLANYFVLRSVLIKKVGKKYKKHLIITTDPNKGYLREHVNKEGLLSLSMPENVGGRFSVLSSVGLFSAAVTGINIDALMRGAQDMSVRCDTNEMKKNIAAVFALINFMYYQKGKHICVFMPYSHAMYDFADWFRQLWAESLGKRVNIENIPVHVGPTPIKALGTTDQHSQVQLYIEGPYDKLFVFLSIEKHRAIVPIRTTEDHYLKGKSLNKLFKAEEIATVAALSRNERPNMSIVLPEVNPHTVGQLIYMLELGTAYCGEFFNINAFDQPGVELSKQYTYALMGRKGFENQRNELEKFSGGGRKNRSKHACAYIV